MNSLEQARQTLQSVYDRLIVSTEYILPPYTIPRLNDLVILTILTLSLSISLTVTANPSRTLYTRSHNLVSWPSSGGTRNIQNPWSSLRCGYCYGKLWKMDFSKMFAWRDFAKWVQHGHIWWTWHTCERPAYTRGGEDMIPCWVAVMGDGVWSMGGVGRGESGS